MYHVLTTSIITYYIAFVYIDTHSSFMNISKTSPSAHTHDHGLRWRLGVRGTPQSIYFLENNSNTLLLRNQMLPGNPWNVKFEMVKYVRVACRRCCCCYELRQYSTSIYAYSRMNTCYIQKGTWYIENNRVWRCSYATSLRRREKNLF